MLYVIADEEFYYEHSVNHNIYVEYGQCAVRGEIEKYLNISCKMITTNIYGMLNDEDGTVMKKYNNSSFSSSDWDVRCQGVLMVPGGFLKCEYHPD